MKKKVIAFLTILTLLVTTAMPITAQETANERTVAITTNAPLAVDYANSYAHSQTVGQDSLAAAPLSPLAERLYQVFMTQDGAQIDIQDYNATRDEVDAAIDEALSYNLIANAAISDAGYRYTVGTFGIGGPVQWVKFDFRQTKDAFDTRYAALEDAVAAARQNITTDMTEAEKVLAFHDYLAQTIDYDQSLGKPDTHGAYGALINKTCVCEGYAKALNLLLSQEGIPSFMVTSDAMNHAWNMVELNGSWYHVDVTFDDPITTMPEAPDYVEYTFFLATDAQMQSAEGSGRHYDWNAEGITSTDTTYINLPRVRGNDAQAQQTYDYGEKVWYYTASADNNVIYRSDFAGNGTTSFMTGGAYSGVLYRDGTLYYTDGQTIRAKAMPDGADEAIYTLSDAEKGAEYPETARLYALYESAAGDLDYYYIWFTYAGPGNEPGTSRLEGHAAGGTFDLPDPAPEVVPVTSVMLDRASAELELGEVMTLNATVQPTNATNQSVSWETSDAEVATVDNGIVKAVGAGTATITVRTEDGNRTATCTVTVKEMVEPADPNKPGGFDMGDINGEGGVNAADALDALRHSVKEIDLHDAAALGYPAYAFERGNVVKASNGAEEVVDASDALDILRFSVKEIDSFERG